jgi:anti-sigma28 factor (negative regulator of flagellin synthesis)
MKIRDRYAQGVRAPRTLGPKEKAAEVVALPRLSGSADSVHFSVRSRDIQKARHLAFHAPEVRASLVDEISRKIDCGHYDVTGADVAPKLIREHLTDALGG